MKSPGIVISVAAGLSQLPLIQHAKNRGFQVLGIDRNPTAQGFDLCDLKVVHSTHDVSGVLAALRQALSGRKPLGVFARTTGAPLYTAAEIAAAFGLPGLTPDLVEISTNKSALRRFCQIHALPTPAGQLWKEDSLQEVVELLPVIVKPDETKQGKVGITLCRTPGQLETALSAATAAAANGRAEISSFIEGIDVGCICRMRRGQTQILALWDELVGLDRQDRIAGVGVSIPSVIETTLAKRRAEDLVRNLVARFPSVDALLAVSLRIDFSGEPWIIELHADLGGDGIAEWLLPAANSSFDFFATAFNISLGREVLSASPASRPTLLYYTPPSPAGDTHELLQEGTVQENLCRLDEILQLRSDRLNLHPLHQQWFEAARPHLEGNT